MGALLVALLEEGARQLGQVLHREEAGDAHVLERGQHLVADLTVERGDQGIAREEAAVDGHFLRHAPKLTTPTGSGAWRYHARRLS